MTVRELNKQLQDFAANITTHTIAAVMDNREKIIALNQEQMLYGKNAEGANIGFLRSVTYARQKIDRGGLAPFRIPDLFNTGAFQSRMILFTDGKEYEIGSTDRKEPDLVAKYGKIFGLVPDQQEVARELTTKSLSKILTKETGIKG